MDIGDELQAESAELERLIESSEKEFDKVTAKHEQAMQPLYWRRMEIKEIRKRADNARAELRRGCADRELLEHYRKVLAEFESLEKQRGELESEIEKHHVWIRNDKEKAERAGVQAERNRYLAQAEAYEDTIDNLQNKLDPIRRSVTGLRTELDAFELQFLVP